MYVCTLFNRVGKGWYLRRDGAFILRTIYYVVDINIMFITMFCSIHFLLLLLHVAYRY
jgi:hypothetical protein